MSFVFAKRFTLLFTLGLGLFSTSCSNAKQGKESESASATKPDQELEKCGDCTVMFYNVENLFDIYDDPSISDEEYTPESEKAWTEERYQTKLGNLAKVISSVGQELPVIVGLCEVENEKVVQDLTQADLLSKGGYEVVHQDSPDNRGIDVSLIYRPQYFSVSSFDLLTVDISEFEDRPTRDILYVEGELFDGKKLNIFVNHWPSRWGGQEESEPKRMVAARVLRSKVEEILASDPGANILIMGDLNDYPDNRSVTEVLDASSDLASTSQLYDLVGKKHAAKEGSYNYKGEWGYLDHIIVSKGLLNGSYPDVNTEIAGTFMADWMMYEDEKFHDMKPNRTYGGPNYFGGYSDHLPVYTKITAP